MGPPSADDLLAVGPDDWAWLLGVIRPVLHDLDDEHATAEVQRLRSSPSSRLSGGRMRRSLAKVIATDGPVWVGLAHALRTVEVPPGLAWLAAGDRAPTASPRREAPAPARAEDPEPDLVRKLKDRALWPPGRA